MNFRCGWAMPSLRREAWAAGAQGHQTLNCSELSPAGCRRTNSLCLGMVSEIRADQGCSMRLAVPSRVCTRFSPHDCPFHATYDRTKFRPICKNTENSVFPSFVFAVDQSGGGQLRHGKPQAKDFCFDRPPKNTSYQVHPSAGTGVEAAHRGAAAASAFSGGSRWYPCTYGKVAHGLTVAGSGAAGWPIGAAAAADAALCC